MYKSKSPQGRRTHASLVQTAVKLITSKGYHQTSVGDIVSTAKVSKPTFYYYFDSKLDLLEEILESSLERVEEALHKVEIGSFSVGKRVQELTRTFALEIMDRPDLLTVYFNERNRLSPEARAGLVRRERQIVSIFETAIRAAQTDLNPRIDPGVGAMAIVGMASWTHRWYRPAGRYSSEEIADYYVGIVRAGVLSSNEGSGGLAPVVVSGTRDVRATK